MNKMDFLASEKKKIIINTKNDLTLLKLDILKTEKETNNKFEIINIIYNLKFAFKYILSSSMIFLILLVSTNYSAYMNIADNYINDDDYTQLSQNMISSVEAASIKEKYKSIKIKKQKNKKTTERLSIKKFKKNRDKTEISLDIEITPYQNRIIIPKIWKNIPLLDIKNRNIKWNNELNNIFTKELEKWIIRYPGSAKPWEIWNSFIFWHSSNFPWIKWDYNDVFSLLWELEAWDKVIVYFNQKKYTYLMKEQHIIKPWDVSVLKRNKNKSELTLMTCWPIWTTLNRLIVIWELIQ